MVTRVIVCEKGARYKEEITPQIVVESGKVGSINVAYSILGLVARRFDSNENLFDFPSLTTSEGYFTVDFFSLGTERTVRTQCKFQFFVTEEYLNTKIIDGIHFKQRIPSSQSADSRVEP